MSTPAAPNVAPHVAPHPGSRSVNRSSHRPRAHIAPSLTLAPVLSSPFPSDDRYVALELDADAVPVINYKKLKKESDARGGGAGGTSPTRGGRGGNNNEDPFAGNAAIDARMGGGGPPAAAPGGPPGRPQDKLPGGGGNHMAEVIRRIEGFYSAPRFQDSDDDDDDDDEADGAARPENDAASESDGEEDMVDDGRDPNDPAVIEDKKRKAAMRAAAKAAKKAKQQTKGGQVYEEWYDMDDDFIDDDELDEYFERTGRTDKLGGKGGDRFYVNAGAIEFVDDGTGHAQAEAAARRRAKKLGMNVAGGDGATGGPGGAGGSEWTERDVDALKRGVAKHGRRWRTIKHDAEFEGWFKQFSMGAMRHKWRIMAKRGLVSDGGDDKVGTPPHPSESQPNGGTNSAPSSGGRDEAAAKQAGAWEAAAAGARGDVAANIMHNYGLGVSGNWCAQLNAAIDHVRGVAARDGAPQKMADGRSPPLSEGMIAALEVVVKVVKADYGSPTFPQGLMAEMMEFLEPFCSQGTLGRNMNKVAKKYKDGAVPPPAAAPAPVNVPATGGLPGLAVPGPAAMAKQIVPVAVAPVAAAPPVNVEVPVPEAYEEESEYV